MRVLFNGLPRVVRERFVQIATNPADRRTFLRQTYGPLTWLTVTMMVLGLLGAIGTVVWLYGEEFGRKDPYFDREVYLLLAGAVFVFLAAAAGLLFRAIWGTSPYPHGLYLFGSALVEARQGALDIVPVPHIGRPTIINRYRNGVYQGSRLELHDVNAPRRRYGMGFASEAQAEEAVQQLNRARQAFQAALASRDLRALEAVDPFVECTLAGRWSEPAAGPAQGGPVSNLVPTPAHVARWAGAAVLGLAASGAVYAVFDSVCEDNASPASAPDQGCYQHGRAYDYSRPYRSSPGYGGGSYGTPAGGYRSPRPYGTSGYGR